MRAFYKSLVRWFLLPSISALKIATGFCETQKTASKSQVPNLNAQLNPNSQIKNAKPSRSFVAWSLALLWSLGLVSWGLPAGAATGINNQINFQGKLVNPDGTNVADGTYNLQFKIYQDGDGVLGGGDETLKWTETRLRNNSQGVTVTNGIFQVNLGSVNAFGSSIDFNQDTLWLSMHIGGTNATCTPFSTCAGAETEMSPFIRFTAAPYALNSGALQGLTKDQFAQLAQGLQADSSTTNASIAINKTGGTANILQLQRGGADVQVIANDGSALFKNQTDSATGFRIQSATAAQTLFTANTTSNIIKIGDSTGTDTATTVLQVDASTADPTTSLSSRNGGLYYNSTDNQLKVIEAGAVARVCTTTAVCAGYAPSAGNGYVQLAPASVQVDSSTNNSVFVNKTGGSGNIVQLQKNGSDVLVVDNNGNVGARNINNIRFADQFSGADGCAKIAAALADLPSTGGTVDARGLEGAQSCAANPFSGVTKPYKVIFGNATYSVGISVTTAAPSSGTNVIEGVGEGTVFNFTNNTAAFSLASNTTLRNFKITSAQTTLVNGEVISQGTSNIHIDGLTFVGGGNHINMVTVSNFVIANTRHVSLTAPSNPISISQSSTHGTVKDIRIENFTYPASASDWRGIGIGQSSYISVVNPIIHDIDASDIITFGGVAFDGATNSSLTGGTISNLKNGDGVLVEGGSVDINITGTVSTGHSAAAGVGANNNVGDGYDIYDSNRVNLTNCVARNNGNYASNRRPGIEIFTSSDVTVTNCDASDNGDAGVIVNGSPNTKLVGVRANRNYGAGVISLANTGTVNTSGTTVTRTGGPSTGFGLAWPANTSITINGVVYKVSSVASKSQLTLLTSAGTQTGVAYAVESTLQVTGGQFNDNGVGAGGVSSREGIYIANASSAQISNAQATDTRASGSKTQTYGARVENSARATFIGNDFEGNLTGSILDSVGTSPGLTVNSSTSSLTSLGQLFITNGTAAAPALALTNSPTTGLFMPSTDVLGISTAGTERLRVDASGNVGIGTAGGNAKLEVQSATGAVSNTGQLWLTDSTSMAAGVGATLNFNGAYTGATITQFGAIGAYKANGTGGDFSGDLKLFARANGSGAWSASSPQLMIQGSSGNVGIGTNSPTTARLVVQGSTSNNTASALNIVNSGGSTSLLQVRNDGVIATGNTINANATGGDLSVSRTASQTSGAILFGNSGNHSLYYNGTNRFEFSDPLYTSGTNNRLTVASTGANELSGINLTARTGSVDKTWIIDNRGGVDAPNNRLAFYDPDTANERFTILEGGNVGIGATNPTQLLTLGAGADRQIIVETATTNAAGNSLSIKGGAAGAGASAFTGGALVLQGGAAGGTGNANGANVSILGGAGVGTGVQGLVGLASTAFNAATNQSFGANGTITQANIDNFSTISISSTIVGPITVTVPNPSNSVVGRILYVTVTGSNNIIVSTPGGTPSFTMTPNSSATYIWNGSVWTNAGVDGGSNSYIQNQSNADQTANFRISGSGRANTSLLSPLFSTIDSQGSGNSPDVTFRSGNAATGNNNSSGSVTLKSGDATNGSNGSSGNIIIDTGAKIGSGTTGSISIGTTNSTSISVGNSAAILTLQAGSGNINLNASQAQFTEVTGTRTLTVQTRTTNVAGSALTVSGGTAGAGASAFSGGLLTLQGGNAGGTGNANGANVLLRGGTGIGTGVPGIVEIDTPVFTASSTQAFGSNGTISQSIVDGNSTIPVNATAGSLTITLPAPTNTTVGRIIYITSVNGSNTFTIAPSGGTNFVMNPNMTGTFVWNGTNWTNAGVDGGSASYVQNQNSVDQVANFRINGAGTLSTIYGGTAASSTLTLAGTSNGSPSNAYIILNGTGQGNVGIGTNSPTTARLVVQGSTSNNTASALNIINSGGSTSLLQVRNDGVIATGNTINANATGGDLSVSRIASQTTGAILFGNSGNHSIYYNGASLFQFSDPLHTSGTNNRLTVASTGANELAGIQLTARTGSVDKTWIIDNRGGVDAPNNRLAFYDPATANERFTILEGGNVGLSTASPDSKLHVVGGGVCIEQADTACAAASGSLVVNGPASGDALTVSNSTSTGNIANFKDNATSVLTLSDFGRLTLSPAASTSGTPTLLTVTAPAHTGLTANTEAIDVNLNLARTVQFATGALTTQRALVVQAPTYGFVGASTITDAATAAITGAPAEGTNATITNSHALLVQGGAATGATNAYGLTVNAPTGATNNYAAAFLGGNVGIGTTTPTVKLEVVGDALFSGRAQAKTLRSLVGNLSSFDALSQAAFNSTTSVPLVSLSESSNVPFSSNRGAYIASYYGDTANSAVSYGLEVNNWVSSANTVTWNKGLHPSLIGIAGTISTASGSTGVIKEGAAFYGTAQTLGAQIETAYVADFGFDNSSNFNKVAGIRIEDIDVGNHSTGLFLTLTGGEIPADGRWGIYDKTGYSSYLGGNVGIGTTSFGTSAAGVLALGQATAPSTSPADNIQLYVTDVAAGDARLRVRMEGGGIVTFPNETGTICTTGSVCSGGSNGNYLVQNPTSNTTNAAGANIISPTANSITGLTVNGTTGTAATALAVSQGGNATALNIAGSGTGNLAVFDTSNASAHGVSIDAQSSSSSQYALRVTSNNGSTTGLYVRADGNVGIGTASPAAILHVVGGTYLEGAVGTNGLSGLQSQASNFNLAPNASFEVKANGAGIYPDGWTGADSAGNGSATTTLAFDSASDGRYAMKSVTTGTTSFSQIYTTSVIPVKPSTAYTSSIDARHDVTANNCSLGFISRISWFTTGFTAASPAYTDVYGYGLTTTSWATYGGTATAPADAAYAKLEYYNFFNTGSCTRWYDNAVFRQVSFTGSVNFAVDGGNVGIGTTTATADLSFGGEVARTIKSEARTGNAAGSALTVAAGNAGAGASPFSGGQLNLQGGNAAGTGNANGGNVVVTGGTGVGTGARGLVVVDTPTVSTTTSDANCGATTSVNCTVAASTVNNTSSVVIGAVTNPGIVITMADPTITTAGRLFYFTAANSSLDFTLRLNAGGTQIDISMRQNSTATLIWNGADWTAAGASSSTTLQSAYDSTLTSAGGAEIVLNNTASSDGLTIRNNATNPIIGGGLLEVQSSIGTNLFSVNNNISELVSNGGAENSSTFATNWTALGTSTITRTTTAGQFATGQAATSTAAGTTAGNGVRANLANNPATSTTYMISFSAKLASGSPAFTDLRVDYTPTGASTGTQCIASQTIITGAWSRITCEVITPGTSVTNPDILIYQVAAPGSARTFYVDNLSMTLADDAGGIPNNVQIGGGINGGAPTLFTLDRSSAPPVANGNTTYLGSMYYDTTTGRIQCYEADGWGACGSAPDNIIVLTPEYTGAVLNGNGIGTLTADFCGNGGGLSVNTTFCTSGLSRQYYKWTSPQATEQIYSIYVSYKLPNTFKVFNSDSTITLTALSDNVSNGFVTYEVFRSTGAAISRCYDGGTNETAVTSTVNTWQTVGINGNETSCGFVGGDNIIFKINVKSKSNANVYVENLNFTYTNN